jgi:hypothetical protein
MRGAWIRQLIQILHPISFTKAHVFTRIRSGCPQKLVQEPVGDIPGILLLSITR